MKPAQLYNPEKMARAAGIGLNVSHKSSAEVCRAVRGKDVAKAIRMLEQVQVKKQALKYTRFNRGGTGHKPGIGPGRYPVKTVTEVVKLLKEVQSNAKNKGFNTSSLIIKHIVANKGSKTMKYGRQRGRQTKRTHIEVIVEEGKALKQKVKTPTKAVAKKPETKPAVKKETPVAVKEQAKAPAVEKKVETKPAEVKQEKKEAVKEEPKATPKVEEKPKQPNPKADPNPGEKVPTAAELAAKRQREKR